MQPQISPALAPAAPIYDDSAWPLFVIRMPPVRLSDAAFEEHLRVSGEVYRRGEPFVILVVMGSHPPLPPVQRKATARAMKADNERYPGLTRGMAVVARSAFERGIVTAVGWLARPPYPFAAFTDVPTARAWLLAQVQR